MNKEKRNIATKLETESKYLTNILDKDDVKDFKKLIPELQDTWHKKQMFRTETEMRFSVLSDNKYPTKAAKYWQSVREQNTHFENLVHLSFDARKNEVEIEKLQRDIAKEKDPLDKKMKQIELEEKLTERQEAEVREEGKTDFPKIEYSRGQMDIDKKLKEEFADTKFANDLALALATAKPETKTAAVKNALAMGLEPGTKAFNDYVTASTIKGAGLDIQFNDDGSIKSITEGGVSGNKKFQEQN